MKTFINLYLIQDTWILSYLENGETKQYTSTYLADIKTKCSEYGFSLDFTGALNGSK